MKLWLEKDKDIDLPDEWRDAAIFTLYRDCFSTIYTSMPNIWYHADQMEIDDVYEDLFTIAIMVFAVDKRISRKTFPDAWTRELKLSIPVLQFDRWLQTKALWDTALSFLTGDKWDLTFRPTTVKYSKHENRNRLHNCISESDCVCLFSGGLDSFCGSIHLLENGTSPCLVGHNEYPKLRTIQTQICEKFKSIYCKQKIHFQSFTANSRAPEYLNGEFVKGSENTSRGRSLLFLCAALSVASILGKDVPVYIPENGFIGLNVPLTSSRMGSCSTRTTHPFFLQMFTDILRTVDIKNPIVNFFAYKSKREIVEEVKNTDAFQTCYLKTISCSHPCVARYNRTGSREYPVNCGYCYPCIIREASLQDMGLENEAMFSFYDFLKENEDSDKVSDLRAVISSIYRYEHSSEEKIRDMIRRTGRLTEEEVIKFQRVYKSTMADLEALFCNDERMKEYIGL